MDKHEDDIFKEIENWMARLIDYAIPVLTLLLAALGWLLVMWIIGNMP